MSMKLKLQFLLLLLCKTTRAFHFGPRYSILHHGVTISQNTLSYPTTSNSLPSAATLPTLYTLRKQQPGLAQNMSTNDNESDEMANKAEGRKKRVVLGYQITSFLFMFNVVFRCIKQGIQEGIALQYWYYAAGQALASGFAYILSGAASHNRLASDTYKRLNLFLAKYGCLGLISAFCMPRLRNPLWTVPCLIAVVNSIKGYGYGVLGWELSSPSSKIFKDLFDMAKSCIAVLLKIPKNIPSATYQAATLTLATVKVIELIEIVQLLIKAAPLDVVTTRILRYSKLMLMTVVSLTLKDAADRDRLEGTTFIELNFMNAAALASMAAYLCPPGSSFTPLVGAVSFFSLSSAFNGVSSIMKKQSKK